MSVAGKAKTCVASLTAFCAFALLTVSTACKDDSGPPPMVAVPPASPPAPAPSSPPADPPPPQGSHPTFGGFQPGGGGSPHLPINLQSGGQSSGHAAESALLDQEDKESEKLQSQ